MNRRVVRSVRRADGDRPGEYAAEPPVTDRGSSTSGAAARPRPGRRCPAGGLPRPAPHTRRPSGGGTPRGACPAAPPALHGPYWQWTRKVAGKTIPRLVPDEQVAEYRQWIDNSLWQLNVPLP